MNQKQIKDKLKVMKSPGLKPLVLDLLMQHDTDIGSYDNEAGPIGYAKYIERTLKILKQKYEQQLQESVRVVQDDLESAIIRAKNGRY